MTPEATNFGPQWDEFWRGGSDAAIVGDRGATSPVLKEFWSEAFRGLAAIGREDCSLLDLASGAVLLEKDADTPLPPASMSKLMTLELVFDALKTGRLAMDDQFRVSAKAAAMGGSKMFIRSGEVVSIENLIRGVVIQSGNDAAVALAEALAGTEAAFAERMSARAAEIGPDVMRRLEKAILLNVLDTNWREHLQTLDHLRSVIWLRGHGQRDPVNEFKTESFALFEGLLDGLRRDVTRMLMHVQVRRPEDAVPERRNIPMTETHANPQTGENEMAGQQVGGGLRNRASAGGVTLAARARADEVDPNNPETWGRVSRNAPCPCGSGKKFKVCHGSI